MRRIALVLISVLSLSACGGTDSADSAQTDAGTEPPTTTASPNDDADETAAGESTLPAAGHSPEDLERAAAQLEASLDELGAISGPAMAFTSGSWRPVYEFTCGWAACQYPLEDLTIGDDQPLIDAASATLTGERRTIHVDILEFTNEGVAAEVETTLAYIVNSQKAFLLSTIVPSIANGVDGEEYTIVDVRNAFAAFRSTNELFEGRDGAEFGYVDVAFGRDGTTVASVVAISTTDPTSDAALITSLQAALYGLETSVIQPEDV